MNQCWIIFIISWCQRLVNGWHEHTGQIIINSLVQYIPRNMHTVIALLCFVVAIHWLIFPYPSGLLHWHCGNLTIALMPAKQSWWIWINTPYEFIMNDYITTTKQSTTKPCAYFLGYTVPNLQWILTNTRYSFIHSLVCMLHTHTQETHIFNGLTFCITQQWSAGKITPFIEGNWLPAMDYVTFMKLTPNGTFYLVEITLTMHQNVCNHF